MTVFSMGFFAKILKSANVAAAPTAVIGIDVGSSAIKIVELEERNEVLTLLTYGEVQLGPYAEEALGSVAKLTPKQQQAALVDVIRESAAQARNAVFAMPLSASFISSTVIETTEDADLGPLVRAEARKLIPASLSEVTLDWVELEQLESHSGRPVLLAAIQNSALDSFKVLLQFAGFTDAPTEIECFSVNRLVSGSEHTVIMDFGASTTKMYVSQNGVLSRMHRINRGGSHITQAFAQALEISFDEAEDLKLTVAEGASEYATLQSLNSKQYNRALREFKQVLQQYSVATGVTFDTVHVCGGAAAFVGIHTLIADTLTVEVSPINSFDQVAYPAFMEDTMQHIGPAFAPALGAALRMFQ